ncbi:MAG: hypothetical protein QXY55_05700 [Candidatus Korarchaeota archaeon]|nr:hypothetical protein [Thermoproteota archaeon]
MKSIRINALSVAFQEETILALLKKGNKLILGEYDIELVPLKDLKEFRGEKGFILHADDRGLLLSIDNRLVLVNECGAEYVLVAQNPNNLFWHATFIDDEVFVQEYGEPPTAIYLSRNLIDWRKLTTNVKIDKRSRHFHFIAYDPHRDQLIVTLGDGNPVRVAFSNDHGTTWRPLYRGPWQFIPIEPLKDVIVFGMDSGIVKGGIGTYYFSEGRWKFVFLKWLNSGVRVVQICDLKRLDNGIYVATLGTPQAVVASKDLTTWYLLYVESFKKDFNHHMMLSEGRNFLACSTGKSLLVFEKDELKSIVSSSDSVMSSYRAYIDRLKGLGFTLKGMLIT